MNRAIHKSAARTGRRSYNSYHRIFEHLEDRRVMAYGSVALDAQGLLAIWGTEGYNDSVKVSIDNRGTSSTYDDLMTVNLNNVGSALIQQFQASSITKIQFVGYAGNDSFENRSGITSDAFGGNGNDLLLGGWGIDRLIAGAGDDYCDGRRGNDSIWGEAGYDALFGDAGDDIVYGGDGNDRLCGGHDRDSLFAGDGADWLDGGWGTEIKMLGGRGSDRFYDTTGSFPGHDINKYSGDSDRTFTGYSSYGWFDYYLADTGVRALSRLDYRDNFITRSEMIGLFNEAQDGGTISSDELNDLRDMRTSGVSMYASTRNLAEKVLYADRANNWYQGSSLGNIYAGASSAHLQKLVNQWFYGSDRPTAFAGSTYNYVSGSLFQNGALYTDIDQEAAGSCYLMSSLADIAQHSPQTIYNMFTDNGDGTFTIRFFNGSKAEYVTVDRYLPVQADGTSQMAGFGGAYWQSTNELWVALAEKAYAQLNESGWINQDGTNSYAGIDAGWPDDAMEQITGRSASRVNMTNSSINTLISANSQGRAISLWTYQSVNNSQLVANHAYSLVGYNSSTQRFTLFNPWNNNNGMPSIVELTASQLTQNFTAFAHVAV